MQTHISKRTQITVANQQTILDTAKELFSKEGYAETSMKDISEKAQLPIGSIYYHFKNKEDLLLQICLQIAKTPMPELAQDIESKALNPYPFIFDAVDRYGDLWADAGSPFAKNVYKTFSHIYEQDHSFMSIDLYKNLYLLIHVAQKQETFDNSISTEDATDFIFMFTRTLIYEWGQMKENYQDIWICGKYLPRILHTFMKVRTSGEPEA